MDKRLMLPINWWIILLFELSQTNAQDCNINRAVCVGRQTCVGAACSCQLPFVDWNDKNGESGRSLACYHELCGASDLKYPMGVMIRQESQVFQNQLNGKTFKQFSAFYALPAQGAYDVTGWTYCQFGRCIDWVISTGDGKKLTYFQFWFCACDRGLNIGTQCELAWDLCTSAPCLNGGTCTTSTTGALFQCTCQPPFTGSLCESVVDQCESAPCQNGGICVNIPTGINYFLCLCASKVRGSRCQNVEELERFSNAQQGLIISGTFLTVSFLIWCMTASHFRRRYAEMSLNANTNESALEESPELMIRMNKFRDAIERSEKAGRLQDYYEQMAIMKPEGGLIQLKDLGRRAGTSTSGATSTAGGTSTRRGGTVRGSVHSGKRKLGKRFNNPAKGLMAMMTKMRSRGMDTGVKYMRKKLAKR